MKNIKILLFIIIYLSCDSKTVNIDCNECGGGLLDGYLYKEVSLMDIANLSEINIDVNVGNCIRFKMDGEDFSSAEIVDDCCCNLYN
ncbi:MAG: hypothetical protein CMG55_04110 [Candidatus Marinimicrobia bacterium]|nr:hypothetical protein [Candidatus Neomarinimicrobiota bacterium]|tara:strand:+ start:816 stop:1076 length:261 start_codon:yes stop_codon:yes gene_type:complete